MFTFQLNVYFSAVCVTFLALFACQVFFAVSFYSLFIDSHTYFFMLQLDSAADYIFQTERASLVYPPPFGRDATAEEAKILEMDSKTGASLKVM